MLDWHRTHWILETINWALEGKYGFRIVVIDEPIETKEIMEKCKDQDAVVIHCGTVELNPRIRKVLEDIKSEYSDIKIGLQTNTKHPHLKKITDFYVTAPIAPSRLQQLLKDKIV